jgi:hypothetical protein
MAKETEITPPDEQKNLTAGDPGNRQASPGPPPVEPRGIPMTQQNDDTFRVIDRRLFNPEGELREDVRDQIEQEEKSEEAAAAKAETKAPGDGKPEPAAEAEAAEKPRRSPAFEMLIDLIARNAVALLGGITDPRTGKPMVDLEGAREVVDMLDALREKTRGNLAPEEEQLMLDIIGSLKMSYLEMSKAAAAAAGRERGQGTL